MTDRVIRRTLPLPPLCEREVLRYMKAGEACGEVVALLHECMEEARTVFSAYACYRSFDLHVDGEVLDLGFAKLRSRALQRHLAGCDRVLIFAATVGLGIDRLVARYSRTSPARALCLNAIGTERIEAACDLFCQTLARELSANGAQLRSRFSPGYGDLPLELQRELFRVLECPKQIGLSLNDSLLMSPSKSVTAIVGISKTM